MIRQPCRDSGTGTVRDDSRSGGRRGHGPAPRGTRVGIFSVIAAMAVLAGCGRVTMDLSGGSRSVYVPVDRLPPELDFQYAPSPEQSHFEIRARAHWILWAVPVNHPDWNTLLEKELQESEGIGNLVIATRVRFGDLLVGVMTLGCYRTTQVIVSGDRIRLVKVAPLSLPESGTPLPETPRPAPPK